MNALIPAMNRWAILDRPLRGLDLRRSNRTFLAWKRLPPWLAIATAAAAVATTAATTAATIATVATTATAVDAESATTATAAILAGLCFVDVQGAAVDFLAIELGDGSFAFLLAGHFDEAKAA